MQEDAKDSDQAADVAATPQEILDSSMDSASSAVSAVVTPSPMCLMAIADQPTYLSTATQPTTTRKALEEESEWQTVPEDRDYDAVACNIVLNPRTGLAM